VGGLTSRSPKLWGTTTKLRPHRLLSGHRRYSPEQVRWLKLIAEAMDRGHRPGALLTRSGAQIRALLAKDDRRERRPRAEERETERLIRLGSKFQRPAFLGALDGARRRLRVEGHLSERIAPLLDDVGKKWEEGKLDICQEHFISELVEDYLRKLRGETGPRRGAPWIVLTTLPGEKHILGLHMVAVSCARAGLNVLFLGRESPPEEIALAARRSGARAVGISVSLATGGVDTDRALSSLRDLLPEGMLLIVGG
jgi:methylmalonyl-CoA mutase cobalamin-binding subunit